ncbi:hypothetical protein TSH58p_18500 (plasmid) [Azospirillum sp. TSH58]|nr:hypothetical protein TSH58p_18500 [Azospirillum sp. TSH58]
MPRRVQFASGGQGVGIPPLHVIWHGFDPIHYPPIDPSDKIITVGDLEDRPDYRGVLFYDKVTERLRGKAFLLGGKRANSVQKPPVTAAFKNENDLGLAHYQNYVHFVRNFGIFFNPTARSPMPRVRGEAMMLGQAVVTTSTHDADRFIDHGYNGFLCDEPDHAVEVLNQLVRDPGLRRRVGKRARDTAMELFHVNNYMREWEELIAREIDGNAHRRPPWRAMRIAGRPGGGRDASSGTRSRESFSFTAPRAEREPGASIIRGCPAWRGNARPAASPGNLPEIRPRGNRPRHPQRHHFPPDAVFRAAGRADQRSAREEHRVPGRLRRRDLFPSLRRAARPRRKGRAGERGGRGEALRRPAAGLQRRDMQHGAVGAHVGRRGGGACRAVAELPVATAADRVGSGAGRTPGGCDRRRRAHRLCQRQRHPQRRFRTRPPRPGRTPAGPSERPSGPDRVSRSG